MLRSKAILTVSAGLLLATAGAVPGVAAQDDPMAMAEHPLVGSWLIDPTPDDPTDALQVFTAGADGTVSNIAPGENGAGSWAPTGERSADAIFHIPQADPDTGFVGIITIRTSIEVAEDGQSVAGTYTLEFPAAFTEAMGLPPGELGPGDVTGERITAEPMGEPVGPIPDFEEPAPPPEE